jgi:hypothetical protein
MLMKMNFLLLGIHGLSKYHENILHYLHAGITYDIAYDPAESTTGMFGGNSNWRGPV